MDPAIPRLAVVSSDTHAGAQLLEYRAYLDRNWHDEFDAWASTFVNPFESEHLLTNDPSCNWDSPARVALLDSQGIAGEVIFPNTVPPFYPQTQFFVPPPAQTRAEYERRWAGLQAHNRWLVDFCGLLAGRRAGVAQIMLEDVDAAVAEIRWVHEVGLRGGILMPGVPPGSELAPLYSEHYDPIWATCAELNVPVNFHSGGGIPHYSQDPVAMAVLLKEVTWFANRNLAHLILGGVFEKYPSLKACFTEQGSSWVVQELASLDSTILMMEDDESSQHFFGGTDMTQRLSLLPSEYFARNCYLGSSPLRLSESNMRYQIGVDRIMWGNDFPHTEGTYPYALEALRYVLADVPEPEIRAITGGTATEVYDLDPTALAEAAKRIGPTLEQIRTPLNDVPDDSLSTVFVPARVEKKRAALAGRRR